MKNIKLCCDNNYGYIYRTQFAILLFIMFITCSNNYTMNDRLWDYSLSIPTGNCAFNLRAQEELDLEKMMGQWYVVEILQHTKMIDKSSAPGMENSITRVIVNICPVVDIRFDEKGFVRLLWTEDFGNIEYTFGVLSNANYKSDGFWISVHKQNGTIVDNKPYIQFNGTVIVTKAVAQHVLLTFCSINTPDTEYHHTNDNDNNNSNNNNKPKYQQQYYSLLMSRQSMLDRSSIQGIHNLFDYRKIGISSIRSTCANNASKMTYIQYNNYLVSVYLLLTVYCL